MRQIRCLPRVFTAGKGPLAPEVALHADAAAEHIAGLGLDARPNMKLGVGSAGRDSAGGRVEDDGLADDVVVATVA